MKQFNWFEHYEIGNMCPGMRTQQDTLKYSDENSLEANGPSIPEQSH